MVRAAFQTQKRTRIRARTWAKLTKLAALQLQNQFGYLNARYSPPGETLACPGCESRALKHLDVMWHDRHGAPGYAAFMTGCRTCGLVFVNPLPTAEALAAFYTSEADYARGWREREAARARKGTPVREKDGVGPEEQAKLRLLFEPVAEHLDILHPPPGGRVLDYGCGPGRLLNRLQTIGWKTYGIEPALATAFPRHVELQAPPDEPTFHLVTLHHVLEHLRNPFEVLQALSRSMLDGGIIYISVPRLDALPRHGDLHYCISAQAHITSYTRDCLTTLLAMAGFETVDQTDDEAMDRLLTGGEPRRMRVFARKAGKPRQPPAEALGAAEHALQEYWERADPRVARLRSMVPVRLRASWLQRAWRHRILAHWKARIRKTD